MRYPIRCALISLGWLAFGALAQNPAPPKAAATPPDTAAVVFKRLDANQDGRISRDEAARMPALAERFDQLDKDKDGFLSAEEFASGFETMKP
jgi:EF hand